MNMSPGYLLFLLILPAPLLCFIFYLIVFLAYLVKAKRNNRPELEPSRRMMKVYLAYLLVLAALLGFAYLDSRHEIVGSLYSVPPLIITYPFGFIALCVFIFLDLRRARRGWKSQSAPHTE